MAVMRISLELAKYVAREILFTFLVGTSLFLLIMLLLQAIRLSEFVIIHQVALKDVAKLSMYLMQSFLPIAVPIAFLFSVVMGISRANSEGEIVALQANGISLTQILTPIFLFSIVVSTFCLYTSFYTVPKGNRAFELLITRLNNERVIATLKPGVFLEFHGLVLYAEQIIPVKNEMVHVFIYDERDDRSPLAITAQAGRLTAEPGRGLLVLRLQDGVIHIDKKALDPIQQEIEFETYDINLELPEKGEVWRAYSPPSYNLDQLLQRIQETTHDLPENRKLLVEYHRRFSLSFSCVVFAILGFLIGILSQRGLRSSSIVLCLLVALVYWVSYIIANATAISGYAPPWLMIWLPNVFFLFVGYLCYRRYRAA